MLVQVIILLTGLSISSLVGYLLSSRQSIKKTVRDSFLGAIIGTIFLTLVLLQYELVALRNMRDEIIKPNTLDQLTNLLEVTPSDAPMINSILSRKEKLEAELSRVIQGRIELRDEDEVIEEWTRLFFESATNVNATNYVSPDFWIEGSEFSAKQFDIQETARQRGVTIKRIFIYVGNSDEELKQINNLVQQQESIGIEVRFISHTKVKSSQAFIKYSPTLNGAIDFVIYDLNVVLLTFPNPDTRQIEWGILTKERLVVDGARDLFEKIWSIADENLYSLSGESL